MPLCEIQMDRELAFKHLTAKVDVINQIVQHEYKKSGHRCHAGFTDCFMFFSLIFFAFSQCDDIYKCVGVHIVDEP